MEGTLEPLKHLYYAANQQQQLQEVIATHRKLINAKEDPQLFVRRVYQSTITELSKTHDLKTKVVAAEKMLFLINERVEGISQAAFNIIELMGATNQIKVKQIAYLIAPYLLKAENEDEKNKLLLLTTNIFLKDFKNLQGDCIVASMAINCLSQLTDSDLTSMIYRELFPLFTCTNP